MTTRPSVPPVRRRRPTDELFEPTPEPTPARNKQTMVYLPASMVAELDRLRTDLRLKYDVPIDRSQLIRAAIRMAQARDRDWEIEATREAS